MLVCSPAPTSQETGLSGTLASAYWGWVKNQLIENEYPMQGRFQFGACRFELDLVNSDVIGIIESTELPLRRTAVQPRLTATTYNNTFLDDFPSVRVELLRAGMNTRYKIYKQNNDDCLAIPESEARTFEDVTAGTVVYLVVANPSHLQSEMHQLVISGEKIPLVAGDEETLQ